MVVADLAARRHPPLPPARDHAPVRRNTSTLGAADAVRPRHAGTWPSSAASPRAGAAPTKRSGGAVRGRARRPPRRGRLGPVAGDVDLAVRLVDSLSDQTLFYGSLGPRGAGERRAELPGVEHTPGTSGCSERSRRRHHPRGPERVFDLGARATAVLDEPGRELRPPVWVATGWAHSILADFDGCARLRDRRPSPSSGATPSTSPWSTPSPPPAARRRRRLPAHADRAMAAIAGVGGPEIHGS